MSMRPNGVKSKVVTESILPEIPQSLMDRAWLDVDGAAWDEIDALDAVRESKARAVWCGMQTGKFRVAWWDSARNGNSWMRHIIHKSTYTDGALQISCAEMVDVGDSVDMIPTSHHTSETADDFVHEITYGAAAIVLRVEWA